MDAVASLPGLAGTVSPGWLSARIDGRGDLHLGPGPLSRSQVMAAAEPLAHAHRAACAHLLATTERPSRTLADLLRAIADFLPFAILGRVLPDALVDAFRADDASRPLPFPARSAGRELAQAMAALRRALGCQNARSAAALVRHFCADHAGWGPLAWEAPGYETPRYVTAMLDAAFGEESEDSMPVVGHQERDNAAGDDALGDYLAFWFDFLERETWYVRRAFWLGIVPLLRAGLRVGEVSGADVLFLTSAEVMAGGADRGVVADRRRVYFADQEYLAHHGIGTNRLAEVLTLP
jgi:hypothetical protein